MSDECASSTMIIISQIVLNEIQEEQEQARHPPMLLFEVDAIKLKNVSWMEREPKNWKSILLGLI